MMQSLSLRLANNRKFLPLGATIGLFALAFLGGMILFPAMRDGQSFFNLFITTPFLLILVVGEGLVIISGGIDLSVSGVLALTTVAAAALLRDGWDPWVVIVLMLAMGLVFGAVMGIFIAYLKVQPFIATLAGMWLARGLCYIISDSEVRIYNPLWRLLGGTKILIPGLADPVTKKGDYVTILVLIALTVLAVGLYIAHFTKFGRTIYSIGGNGGMNEQSARLMGLRVDRTKVQVYMLSGFCSALAGIVYSIYVGSGHGTHATGMELTAIAAVVIGGMALTGGEGYLIGGLFGVLITALIQSLIQFNGQLSSWWTSIVIGGLMLVFIGIQSLLASWNARQLSASRLGTTGTRSGMARRRRPWRDRRVLVGAVAVVAVLVGIQVVGGFGSGGSNGTGAATACQLKAFRQDRAAELMKAGAVIAYERNGGSACVDELYAIYPDGRMTADNGSLTAEKKASPEDVQALLGAIGDLGWFTDKIYSTSETQCGQCYTYYTTVSSNGQEKTVKAVDGGTATPANYWLVTSKLSAILPPLASGTQ
jgi:ribose/xylose/arabinose/galactoside ABC-type transport system permease subunit